MLAAQAVAPAMVSRKHGSIINIVSIAGRNGGGPGAGAYATAKGGLITFTKSLAKELAPHGVRVNAVSPGPTMSARFMATRTLDESMMGAGVSLERYATPAEIANVVAFLASENSSFISGQVLRVDGAATLFAA